MNNLSKTFRYVNSLGGEIIFDYDHGYLINKPDGIDTLSINLSTAQGIGQIGATVQAQSVQVRPIVISGIICGDDQDAKKDALQAVVRPDLSGTLYADTWSIAVYVSETPTIGPQKKFANFTLQLTAPYPYWQSEDEGYHHLSGVEGRFKFPWNISKSYQFGTRIQNAYAIINNTGQTDCPFTIVIHATNTVTNPKIENILTGEFLQIEKELVQGEQLVIEITHDRTYVTSNIDGDCRGALTLESNLFRLHTGDNVLRPSADAGLSNIDLEVTYAPERVGIVV